MAWRVLVLMLALAAAVPVCLVVSMGVAMSYQVAYPVSGFVATAVLSLGAVGGVVALHRGRQRRKHWHASVWILTASVLTGACFGFFVGRFVHGLSAF